MGRIEILLVLLVLATGLIHIHQGYLGMFTTLILAGVGFLGGAVLFYLDFHREILAAACVPYTAVQFYFFYQTYGLNFNTIGAVDKLVQVLLIISAFYYLMKNSEELREELKNLI